MKEHEIIPQLLSELDAATADGVSVRTTGGDQNVSIPEVIVDWDSTRSADGNGHNSFGGYITDSQDNHIGIEHHTYWQMTADCIARFEDENKRDEQLHVAQSAFIPYESNPGAFDSDTRSWEIGSTGPRENQVVEPDWYEAGFLLSFEYLKRSEETDKDYIESVEHSVEIDESLEETISETK